MGRKNNKYTLRLRAKILISFLFLFVGIPMLYVAVRNVQAQHIMIGTGMVMLFIIWGLVILKAIGFSISIGDNEIQKRGLFGPSTISYSDIDTISFGGMLSSFYLQSEGEKFYIGNDYSNYSSLVGSVIDKVEKQNDMDQITIEGKQETVKQYVNISG